MLHSISATNLLSFGPEGMNLDLSALTVLIGPNGSGNSNLLEVIGLLQAAPIQLAHARQKWRWCAQLDLERTSSCACQCGGGSQNTS